MNGFIKWFDSKSKLKRWMLLILIGVILMCYGTAELLVLKELSFAELAKIVVVFIIGVVSIILGRKSTPLTLLNNPKIPKRSRCE